MDHGFSWILNDLSVYNNSPLNTEGSPKRATSPFVFASVATSTPSSFLGMQGNDRSGNARRAFLSEWQLSWVACWITDNDSISKSCFLSVYGLSCKSLYVYSVIKKNSLLYFLVFVHCNILYTESVPICTYFSPLFHLCCNWNWMEIDLYPMEFKFNPGYLKPSKAQLVICTSVEAYCFHVYFPSINY